MFFRFQDLSGKICIINTDHISSVEESKNEYCIYLDTITHTTSYLSSSTNKSKNYIRTNYKIDAKTYAELIQLLPFVNNVSTIVDEINDKLEKLHEMVICAPPPIGGKVYQESLERFTTNSSNINS